MLGRDFCILMRVLSERAQRGVQSCVHTPAIYIYDATSDGFVWTEGESRVGRAVPFRLVDRIAAESRFLHAVHAGCLIREDLIHGDLSLRQSDGDCLIVIGTATRTAAYGRIRRPTAHFTRSETHPAAQRILMKSEPDREAIFNASYDANLPLVETTMPAVTNTFRSFEIPAAAFATAAVVEIHSVFGAAVAMKRARGEYEATEREKASIETVAFGVCPPIAGRFARRVPVSRAGSYAKELVALPTCSPNVISSDRVAIMPLDSVHEIDVAEYHAVDSAAVLEPRVLDVAPEDTKSEPLSEAVLSPPFCDAALA
eukprot:2158034-Rhodomonas_salina.1